MATTQTCPTDNGLIRDCDFFDLHVDWLKNGWAEQNSLLQAICEISNTHYAEFLKYRHGYGDLDVSTDRDTDWSYMYKELIVLSVNKTECVNNLTINTLSFYEGEVLRIRDLGLPDYRFEPFHAIAKNKTQLRSVIKEYGKHLHEKYSGDHGKICIRYY